jgi:hypothetical protein
MKIYIYINVTHFLIVTKYVPDSGQYVNGYITYVERILTVCLSDSFNSVFMIMY